MAPVSSDDRSPSTLRYARHLALNELGETGQARIREGRVLLVGLGGLGAAAAAYLASSGIGTLVLNDFDRVDETNLQRQPLYATEDIGRPKTEAASATLHALNPDVRLEPLDRRLGADELRDLAGRCDVVLDGSDNFATRFAVNAACVAARTPLVSGAAIRFEGQLAVFRSDLDGLPCYRCLYDESDEPTEDCRSNGVFAPLVGVIGSLMAAEALKLVAGLTPGADATLHLFDALASRWRAVRLRADPSCPVCSA